MSTLKCILGHNVNFNEVEYCNYCRAEKERQKLMIESGAINRLDKRYRLTLHLTRGKRLLDRKTLKLTLDGSSTYYDVIEALKKTDYSENCNFYFKPNWEIHVNILPEIDLPYLLCEYENTKLSFNVVRYEINRVAATYCPRASDLNATEKIETPAQDQQQGYPIREINITKIVRCPAGHYFDSAKYADCPYCKKFVPFDVSALSEEQKKIYHLTLNLKDEKKKVELDLPGWSSYFDVIKALKATKRLKKRDFSILGWKWSENGPCRLYDYDETELSFDVKTENPEEYFTLYGCPMASDIKVAGRSERPVRIIRFGDEK